VHDPVFQSMQKAGVLDFQFFDFVYNESLCPEQS
jgi:hypothetical protein